jgi:hypothetical protein
MNTTHGYYRHVYRRVRDHWRGKAHGAGAFDQFEASTNERLFRAAIQARCQRQEHRFNAVASLAPETVRLNLEAAKLRRLTGWARQEWERRAALDS